MNKITLLHQVGISHCFISPSESTCYWYWSPVRTLKLYGFERNHTSIHNASCTFSKDDKTEHLCLYSDRWIRVIRKILSGARSNRAPVVAAAATRDRGSPTVNWDVQGLTFFNKNKITFLILTYRFLFCLSLFLSLSSFYLLIVGIEGYCCITSHSRAHTHTLSTIPLDEWSARRRNFWQHTTLTRKTSMPPSGFKLAVTASEWPQNHVLDRAATGIGLRDACDSKKYWYGNRVLLPCLPLPSFHHSPTPPPN